MGQFNMGGFADNRKGKRNGLDDPFSSSEGFDFFGFGGFSGGPDFGPDNMPEGGSDFGGGNMPDMNGFGRGAESGSSFGTSKLMTLMIYGLCLIFMLVLMIGIHSIKRRR